MTYLVKSGALKSKKPGAMAGLLFLFSTFYFSEWSKTKVPLILDYIRCVMSEMRF